MRVALTVSGLYLLRKNLPQLLVTNALRCQLAEYSVCVPCWKVTTPSEVKARR